MVVPRLSQILIEMTFFNATKSQMNVHGYHNVFKNKTQVWFINFDKRKFHNVAIALLRLDPAREPFCCLQLYVVSDSQCTKMTYGMYS